MSGAVLGFDFGTHKIGVAIGQTVTASSRGLATLKARNGKPDWAELDRLIKEWQPVALVVGRPVHMDGTPQEMTERAEAFGRQLQQRYRLPVHLVDERLSSHEAESLLDEEYGRGRYTQTEIDKLAASLILDGWLREQK